MPAPAGLRALLAGVAAAGVAAAGCGEASTPPRAAPAHARAALVLEPPVVALGQVADVVLAVVTPPGVGVRPVEPPQEVPGFAVVERESLEVVREPARWVHRTRVRLRAMQVGRFEFPAGSVALEDAEGSIETLAYAALPLEVVSSQPGHGGRSTPYGIRSLAGGAGHLPTLVAFTAGAALALAAVGLVALGRRRLTAPPAPAPLLPPADPPWLAARAALRQARELAERDPRDALDRTARALRRYAVQRFGGDAHVRTTPELTRATPPFALTTRWSGFVALLAALDAARFPRDASGATPGRARELVDEALAFVNGTVPPEARN